MIGLWVFMIGYLGADQKKEDPLLLRPPLPQSTAVEAHIGTTKEIPLRISGRIEEPLKIIVRKQPRLGTLSEPLLTGRNTISFTYTAHEKAKAGGDSFTYAVQSVDSPVSVPARVDIRLMERPAALRVVEVLDFPLLDVGDEAEKVLLIENTGGATAFFNPSVKSPWHLRNGGTNISIPGGGRCELGILFTPEKAGKFSGRLNLNEKTGVRLLGESIVPLDWPVRGVHFDAASRKKGVTNLVVSNLTSGSKIVEIEWPPFFDALERTVLGAGSKLEIPVRVNAPPAFSKKGSVKISAGGFKGEIPFVIHPEAADVHLSPEEPIEFGQVDRDSELRATIELTNRGGLPIFINLGLPQQIKSSIPSYGVELEPGKGQRFEILWKLGDAGQHNERIEVRSNERLLGEFQLSATVKAAQPVEKLLDIPTAPAPAAAPTQPSAAIPPVEESFLEESTPHSVTIRWKLTSPETKDFLVERRLIRRGPDGRVSEHWEPWRQVEIRISDDTATAHFRKLASGTFWNIRLRGIDSKGLLGPPTSGHFRIATQPINSWRIPLWLLAPTATLLAGGIFLVVKKYIRLGYRENLDRRIARLEK